MAQMQNGMLLLTKQPDQYSMKLFSRVVASGCAASNAAIPANASCRYWLTRILGQGSAQGQLRMLGSAYAEAQTLMATVHGAMLVTRIANDPQRFQPIVRLAIKHLLP